MAREGDLGVLSFGTMEERELKPQPLLGEEGSLLYPHILSDRCRAFWSGVSGIMSGVSGVSPETPV
jgi:hypothetical protein